MKTDYKLNNHELIIAIDSSFIKVALSVKKQIKKWQKSDDPKAAFKLGAAVGQLQIMAALGYAMKYHDMNPILSLIGEQMDHSADQLICCPYCLKVFAGKPQFFNNEEPHYVCSGCNSDIEQGIINPVFTEDRDDKCPTLK